MYGESPWLHFVDAEIEPLFGVFAGFTVGGLCAFWPSMAERFYGPLFGRYSGAFIKLLAWSGLGYGAWSLLVLALRIG